MGCISLRSHEYEQASATRSQDEQYFANQQALLQQQLADLKLKAEKFGSESREASDSLRKKRLKLQQEVEVRQLSDTLYRYT